MPRSSSELYSPTTSPIRYFDGEEREWEGSLGTAMEDKSFEETDSDEYVMVVSKNGRVKRKNRGEQEGAMEAKKSKGGQKGGRNGQTGHLTIKVRGLKEMAAFNVFKVATWIGEFVSRAPEVKVERTKEANLLVTFSTLGARKLVV